MESPGSKNLIENSWERNLVDTVKKYTFKNEFAFLRNRKSEQKKSSENMNGKVCVVSGGTSGVGFESLKKFAQGGAELILVARNPQKAESIKKTFSENYNVSVDIFICDFSNLESVRKAAGQILEKYKVIDVLVNSAGLHSTTRKTTKEGFELVFCVNHLASFLFTYLLLPLIKESENGRIIQVNSEGHRFGGLNLKDLDWKKRPYIGLRGYGASKTAQIMTVIKLAELLEDSNVTINAMHPGGVRTAIGSNNGVIYRTWLRLVVWHFLKDPEVSGESVYYLASSPDINGISGRYFNLTIEEKPAPHVFNEKKSREIWDLSFQLTGLEKPI